MLHYDYKRVHGAGFIRNLVDSIDDSIDFVGSEFTCADDVLNVNDEKGGWH